MKSVFLVKNLSDHRFTHSLENHFLAPSPSDGPAPCDCHVRHWDMVVNKVDWATALKELMSDTQIYNQNVVSRYQGTEQGTV